MIDWEAAALAAEVELREVTDLAGFAAVQDLFERIWRPEPHNPPVTTEWLRALTKAGNYVVAAYREGRMAGACVAFFGPPGDASMHSHIAGVLPGMGGVGYAIKLHQRTWALDRGVRTIAWTFDPLISRNAYFNLVKLGVTAEEYLPDFYGGMDDGINSGDESDRLLAVWDLAEPRGGALPWPGDAAVALGRDDAGAPVPGTLDGDVLLVAVPGDVSSLRETEPGLARAWREATRDVLGERMAAGYRVAGFDRSGWYILRKESE